MKAASLPEGLPTIEPRLTRVQAAEYLTKLGFPMTKDRLDRLAMKGGGPAYHRFSRRCALYRVGDLLAWAQAKEGAAIQHTAQAAA